MIHVQQIQENMSRNNLLNVCVFMHKGVYTPRKCNAFFVLTVLSMNTQYNFNPRTKILMQQYLFLSKIYC